MALWQRLVVTIIVMLAASFVAGLIWHGIFGVDLPSYLAGMVGGLTALPVWELMKRIDVKPRR